VPLWSCVVEKARALETVHTTFALTFAHGLMSKDVSAAEMSSATVIVLKTSA